MTEKHHESGAFFFHDALTPYVHYAVDYFPFLTNLQRLPCSMQTTLLNATITKKNGAEPPRPNLASLTRFGSQYHAR